MISIRSTYVKDLKTVAQKMAQIQREMRKTPKSFSPLNHLEVYGFKVMNKLRKYFIAIKMLLKTRMCQRIHCDRNYILKRAQYKYA